MITKNEQTDSFFKAVLSLKTEADCYKFFDDVCTEREVGTMVQRFAVAKMLLEGCVYTEIAKETGASTATISRVKRGVNNGTGGYKIGTDGLYK